PHFLADITLLTRAARKRTELSRHDGPRHLDGLQPRRTGRGDAAFPRLPYHCRLRSRSSIARGPATGSATQPPLGYRRVLPILGPDRGGASACPVPRPEVRPLPYPRTSDLVTAQFSTPGRSPERRRNRVLSWSRRR